MTKDELLANALGTFSAIAETLDGVSADPDSCVNEARNMALRAIQALHEAAQAGNRA